MNYNIDHYIHDEESLLPYISGNIFYTCEIHVKCHSKFVRLLVQLCKFCLWEMKENIMIYQFKKIFVRKKNLNE